MGSPSTPSNGPQEGPSGLSKARDGLRSPPACPPAEPPPAGRYLTPLRAIRTKCLDCSGGSVAEIRLCVMERCPLYPFRRGHRPTPEDVERHRAAVERERQRTGA
jgi:hypothetical protein